MATPDSSRTSSFVWTKEGVFVGLEISKRVYVFNIYILCVNSSVLNGRSRYRYPGFWPKNPSFRSKKSQLSKKKRDEKLRKPGNIKKKTGVTEALVPHTLFFSFNARQLGLIFLEAGNVIHPLIATPSNPRPPMHVKIIATITNICDAKDES